MGLKFVVSAPIFVTAASATQTLKLPNRGIAIPPNSDAAMSGGAKTPRMDRQWTDKVVKQPADRGQVRISWRHPARNFSKRELRLSERVGAGAAAIRSALGCMLQQWERALLSQGVAAIYAPRMRLTETGRVIKSKRRKDARFQ